MDIVIRDFADFTNIVTIQISDTVRDVREMVAEELDLQAVMFSFEYEGEVLATNQPNRRFSDIGIAAGDEVILIRSPEWHEALLQIKDPSNNPLSVYERLPYELKVSSELISEASSCMHPQRVDKLVKMLPSECFNSRMVVTALISKMNCSTDLLKFVPYCIATDKEIAEMFIEKCVRGDGYLVYAAAGEYLQSDVEFAKKCIEKTGPFSMSRLLTCAPKNVLDDMSAAVLTISQMDCYNVWKARGFFSTEIQEKIQISLLCAAKSINIRIYSNLPPAHHDNKDLLLLLFSSSQNCESVANCYGNASPSNKSDLDLVRAAVSSCHSYYLKTLFQLIPGDCITREIVNIAISRSSVCYVPQIYAVLPDEFRFDMEIVFSILKCCEGSFILDLYRLLPIQLASNLKVCFASLERSCRQNIFRLFSEFPPEIKRTIPIAMSALDHADTDDIVLHVFRKLDDELKFDKRIITCVSDRLVSSFLKSELRKELAV